MSIGNKDKGVYSSENLPRRKPVVPQGPMLTEQSHKDDCDINKQIERAVKTGMIPPSDSSRTPIFGDFTYPDFMDMKNAVIDAEQAFMSLPARIRNRFQNDAAQLIRFCDDPKNRDEAIKLGLIPEPEKAPVAPKVDPDQTDLVVTAKAAEKAPEGPKAPLPT